jgi:hypothetical protein
MGKRKQTSTTTNQHQFLEQPTNQYYQQAATGINSIDLRKPVQDAFARKTAQINEGNYNVLGKNTNPALKNLMKEEDRFAATTQLGSDLSDAVARENQLKTGGYMDLGNAHRSQLVNSGSSSVNTQKGSFLDALGQLGSLGLGVGSLIGTGGASAGAGA